MHRMRIRARRIVVATAIGGVALAAPTACSNVNDTLLEAPIPTVIDPSAANSAAGADALRIGALSRLRGISAGSGSGDSPWMFSDLITDQWKSSDTFSQRNETDQRSVQDNNANLTPILRDLYRARTSAREAITALQAYAPTPAANVGQMYMVLGVTETYLAEWFCNGAPLPDASTETPPPSPGLTNAAIYAVANAHFDLRSRHDGGGRCLQRIDQERGIGRKGPRADRDGQVPGGRGGRGRRPDKLSVTGDVLVDVGKQPNLVARGEREAMDGRR
jgi:hypothetical protein